MGALPESASLLKINRLWFIYPGEGAAGFPAPGLEAEAAVLLPNLVFQSPWRMGSGEEPQRRRDGHFEGCSDGDELGVFSQPRPWDCNFGAFSLKN